MKYKELKHPNKYYLVDHLLWNELHTKVVSSLVYRTYTSLVNPIVNSIDTITLRSVRMQMHADLYTNVYIG